MSKPLILMYHRIADEPVDYWGLAVSPKHFEDQLSVLRRKRQPLPLTQFVDELFAGTLSQDAVALTFDDGYVDNLEVGLPLLEAAGVPATVFLAAGFVDRLEPFWWDELANLILREDGPRSLEFVIRGQDANFSIDACSSSSHGAATPGASLKPRHAFLEAIYHPLRLLHDAERSAIMAKLRASFPLLAPPSSRAMTSEEVRALVRGGLVVIGAHTVTHPSMPALDAATCEREVRFSKRICEDLAGTPATAFCYPYAEFNSQARAAVKAAGYSFACAKGLACATTSDIFALPRLYVPNLSGDEFEKRLCWASDAG